MERRQAGGAMTFETMLLRPGPGDRQRIPVRRAAQLIVVAILAAAGTMTASPSYGRLLGGAIGGALVGGIIGGRRGMAAGAVVGGIAGAARAQRDRDAAYYHQQQQVQYQQQQMEMERQRLESERRMLEAERRRQQGGG